MNSEMRERIFRLRAEGVCYKEIAQEMDISFDSVKAFCRRNHLIGPSEVVSRNIQFMKETHKICRYCCKQIRQNGHGRMRLYCSENCRRKWWQENKEMRTKKASAIYHFICKFCRNPFSSYGNKVRKYFSHRCYIK
jgi:hypothetical protein